MFCDTCALKARSYMFSDISGHTVVIGRKIFKLTKKTICDTCALKLRSYKFSDILGHTVLISRKTVK